MKNSLYESYRKLERSYYGVKIEVDKLFDCDEKTAKDNCRKFIDEHFEKGRKSLALVLPFEDEYKSYGKHIHSVSLLLMCYLLYPCFYDALSKEILEKTNWQNQNCYGCCYTDADYMYSCFLMCLYHDMSSCIEDNPDYKNSIAENLSPRLSDLLKFLNISYDVCD